MLTLPLHCVVCDLFHALHHSEDISEEVWSPDVWDLGNPQEFSDTVWQDKQKHPQTVKGPYLLMEHAVLSYL